MTIKKAKTFIAKPRDTKRAWHVVDLSGKVLGREITRIAAFLTGKMKLILLGILIWVQYFLDFYQHYF